MSSLIAVVRCVEDRGQQRPENVLDGGRGITAFLVTFIKQFQAGGVDRRRIVIENIGYKSNLAAKMIVNRRNIDVCDCRNVAQRNIVESTFGKQTGCSAQYPFFC